MLPYDLSERTWLCLSLHGHMCVSVCVQHYGEHPIYLQKTAHDPTQPNNYRPISKLPFISKIPLKNHCTAAP